MGFFSLLTYLSIKNFSIIEQTEIELDTGLNIITGETGAGKTVLVEALKVLLGEKLSQNMYRDKDKKVTLEAIFIDDFKWIKNELKEYYSIAHEIIIKRECSLSGKNKNSINGSLASLKSLKEISYGLMDFHGQHEHQKLLDASTHLKVLDNLVDRKTIDQYKGIYSTYINKKKELEKLEAGILKLEKERELYEFQIRDIESANIDLEEDNKLDEKIKLLSNSEKIREAIASSIGLLKYSDINISEMLSKVIRRIGSILPYTGIIGHNLESLKSIEYELSDIATVLEDFHNNIEADPRDVDILIERKFNLESLKKRYTSDLEGILKYKDELLERFDKFFIDKDHINILRREFNNLYEDLKNACSDLNDKRYKASKFLEKELISILKVLELQDTVFESNFQKVENLSENGNMTVEFYISTNKGFIPAPLSDVASGGELSRIMLALKEIFSDFDETDTILFDEIDVGIGGITAKKIAEKLAKISKNKQLIVITHLPVIAATGKKHIHLKKNIKMHKSFTEVITLDLQSRKEVLATMIAGSVSDSSLKQAEELLKV